MDGRNIHLVLLLDTLGLATGRGAASRAGVGAGRAADSVGRGRGSRGLGSRSLGSRSRGDWGRSSRGRTNRGRGGRDRGVRETAGGDVLGQPILVELLEPSLGDLGVILQKLALDALLDQGLLLDLVNSGREDVSL